MAQLILKIAEVKPYKRRRLKFLREKHPVLLRRLEEMGLIDEYALLSIEGEWSEQP